MWPNTEVARLIGVAAPIIQAPMAGEPDRPELTAAVSQAGGLGSLGCAYDQPETIRAKIAAVRALTDRPFAVNLFASVTPETDAERIAFGRTALAERRTRMGVADTEPVLTMPDFDAQLAVVAAERPAVFSFTFGALGAERITSLKQAGLVVIGTATTVPEAERLAADGVDAIVAQGAEAGAHRGTFLGAPAESLIGTMALVPAMVDRVSVPVIAAGGLMDGRGIAAALMLGAAGVQMGTAFLPTEESGAAPAWKDALLQCRADRTSVTTVFSGRHARGIRNAMMRELSQKEHELPGFPAMNSLTRGIRSAASRSGDADSMSLWAGQGATLARAMRAGDLVRLLVEETGRRLAEGLKA